MVLDVLPGISRNINHIMHNVMLCIAINYYSGNTKKVKQMQDVFLTSIVPSFHVRLEGWGGA